MLSLTPPLPQIHTQCHVSSVPVYAGLKNRNLKVYSAIVTAGIAICLFIYTLTGTFGYLTFQDKACKINSDILRNYPASDIPINVARFMLAIVMVSSYPIPAYCGRWGVWMHVRVGVVCLCDCVHAERGEM